MYRTFFIATSILGLAYHPYFYCFHLFDVCRHLPVMGFVVQAISQNVGRIINTIILTLMLLYAFALFGIFHWRSEWGWVADTDSICTPEDPLSTCIRQAAYLGYQSGPNFPASEQGLPDVGALIFSLVYYIILVQIMTSVVSGIIIDSFSELRGTADQIDGEIENRCFICCQDRSEFQKEFDYHVSEEHNKWNYIAFLIHVQEAKLRTDLHLSGIERSVLILWENSKFKELANILPIKRALAESRAEIMSALADLVTMALKKNVVGDVNAAVETARARTNSVRVFSARTVKQESDTVHYLGEG